MHSLYKFISLQLITKIANLQCTKQQTVKLYFRNASKQKQAEISPQIRSSYIYRKSLTCESCEKDPLPTHGGLDSGKVLLWKAGGGCAVGGVNGWISRDGGGATSAVRVFNVPAAVAAGATTLLQPAGVHAEPQFRAPVEITAHKVGGAYLSQLLISQA